MTKEDWKPARMSALLCCSFTFLLLLRLEGCHGQEGNNGGGANFFYYYSPTQRTMVSHGGHFPSGNIFSSPFLNQQQVQPTLPPFGPQQPALPNLQYSSPATPLLGYQQTQSPVQPMFTTQQPLGQFQFQQFGQQPQHNLVQPTAAFPGFTRFGHNLFPNNNAQQAYLQPGAPTLQPPQQQQHQQQQSFFESPFQFIQQRYLQTPPTPSAVPAPAPEHPLPATTLAPTLQPQTVGTPTGAPRRRQKFSSRFRYVQPEVQYQFNPYTRLTTPITSTLPFTEQRYYSTVLPSVSTPTGYSFSLGGDGTGSTSSVHVSMGPLSRNFQQHLTEITQIRRVAENPRKDVVYEDQLAVEHMVPDPVIGAGSLMMSHDAPMMEATSEQTTSSEVPSPPPTPLTMDSFGNMTSTMDTLLNEPSFQMEMIAEPAPTPTTAPNAIADNSSSTTELDASAKISEANIPRRLAIRKKVARKRLRLDNPEAEVNQGRSVDGGGVAVPTGRRRFTGRRRISQNRLSEGDDEPGKEYEGQQKGLVEESSPESIVSSATTPSAVTVASSSPANNDTMSDEPPQAPEMMQITSSTTTTAAPPPQSPAANEQDETPKFMVPSNDPETLAENIDKPQEMPESILSTPATPLTTTSPTTTTSVPPPMTEEVMKQVTPDESPMMMDGQPKHDDYYYEEYDETSTGQQQQPKAIIANQQAPALLSEPSSDSNASSESSSDELPVLDGVRKEDFPTVFGADSSVETDKGEVITRPVASTPSTTTTTEESIPPAKFMNDDPPEEQPPSTSDELDEPVFQPLSTTQSAPVMSTTTVSSQTLSTTASPAAQSEMEHVSSEEYMEDSYEDEAELDFKLSEQPSSTASSATEAAIPEENDKPIDSTMPSSTESSQEDAIRPAQPQSVENDQEMIKPMSPSEMNDSIELDIPSSSTAPAEASSSTTEESPLQSEDMKDEPSSSSTQSPNEDDDAQTASSSTTIPPLPSPATTESPEESQEDFPQSNETSAEQSDSSQIGESGEKLTSDEVIGKAQRLALEESLRRLREKQQNQSTESTNDVDQDEESNNGTISTSGESQPKRKLRNFVRRPLQLSNLTLPTSRPVINAVLDDGAGEHQNRHQVIEKIQRFRSTFRRVPTTTKRPRRVTRPTSTERLPLPDLDSFSDSSSSTSGPVEFSSTPTYPTPSVFTTTETPSTSKTYLTSTTEAVTTVEPTTTTTTTSTSPTEMLTTDSGQGSSTTFPEITTPSTTTITIDDFLENDDKLTYNEDDHVYYDEDHHDSTDPSSTTVASSTGGSEMMYTTPSTTTTPSSTEGPFMTATERTEPEEFSTDFSTTTTDIPLATTTTAGQLIIHEILPTMPPLKEVSFVIGESVEEDQVIQSNEGEKQSPLPSVEASAVIRVKVSSSVSGEEGSSASSQQISSEEGSNEGPASSTPSPSTLSSSVETTGTGRKVRVVIRQRQMRTGRRTTSQQNRRRRRKIVPKQLRRQS